MIFKNVAELRNKQDKSLFNELISIYCGIVRELSHKYHLEIEPYECNGDLSLDLLSELKSIGVIMCESQIADLKRELGGKYIEFLSSVCCFLRNKVVFGNLLDKLSNSKREQAQREEAMQNKPKLIDFFAGAGGLSLGFIQQGFSVHFANDIEDVCVNTYRYNHPELPSNRVLLSDIRNIVDNIQDYILSDDIDVVVGGPPCQGFSSANQQRIIDDPRNELYKYFLKAVERILPKFVVMENVRGMLSVAGQVVDDFKSIQVFKQGKAYSYLVDYQLLNSADFSVAQSRERVFYIAARNDLGVNPSVIFEQIRSECTLNPRFILSDALIGIKPLEAPREKNMTEVDSDVFGKKIDFNSNTSIEAAYLDLINGGKEYPLTFNHKARYVNDVNYDIYRLLEQGDDASNEKIKGIMPYENRLHCFRDKYYKMRADRPSRTITAHLKMDCHSHIHPYQIRAITPREAARIQSFPDSYLFLGAYLKTYMQIGNAVPCLMGKGIASVIKRYLVNNEQNNKAI